ncbi:serine hydrolase [Intrasporangium sp. DVR]|uniref:serine hydrolase n=1 Tax=Intrasporangium sp. DVR TaxID=3127867 RepID=UPI00313A5A1E
MNETVHRLLELLQGSEPVPPAAAAELASPEHPRNQLGALAQVFEGVRRSSPVPGRAQQRTGDLTVIPVSTSMGVQADLFITTAQQGALDGLRIEARPQEVTTPDDLRRELRRIDPGASVVVDGPRIDDDGRVKAVASLAKIFVLATVLQDVEEGRLHLDDTRVVTHQDISSSSAGLGADHVGSRLTVGELAQLMVLRSDNTATDILIDLVGLDRLVHTAVAFGVPPEDACRFKRTRDIWGGPPATGPRAPVHTDGHDYFVPLRAVTTAMHHLATRPWLPWPPSPEGDAREPILYKGGSAPGVLAAVWRSGPPLSGIAVAIAVNAERELGLLEEIHVFSCAERLVTELTTSRRHTPPAAGTHQARTERHLDVH